MISLKELVNIQTGYYLKPSLKGEICYIQTKCFDSLGNLNFSELNKTKISLNLKSEKLLLNSNDILLSAKGRQFSYLYDQKIGKAIASSSFYIIKLSATERILPEFLSWYLNTNYSQNYFKKMQMGTSITSISKTIIMELPVIVPDMNIQYKIVELNKLLGKEKEITIKVSDLKYNLYQEKMFNLIKGGNNA